MDSPGDATERTVSTPGSPFMTTSNGAEINCSTSSLAIPPASDMIVTVGLLRSGKTSTGVLESVYIP